MEEFLLPNGKYELPYYDDLMFFSKNHHCQFGNKHAMYTLPTIELIEELTKMIGDQSAIEIGSGIGIIGEALGIKCTDNFCQNKPEAKMAYGMMGAKTIDYGDHVIKRDAEWVAKKWSPDIILGSWITHKWNPSLPDGNQYGPDEEIILDNCKQYIMLGNEFVHQNKPILKYKPRIMKDFKGYVTRSNNPECNAVFIWKGRKI